MLPEPTCPSGRLLTCGKWEAQVSTCGHGTIGEPEHMENSADLLSCFQRSWGHCYRIFMRFDASSLLDLNPQQPDDWDEAQLNLGTFHQIRRYCEGQKNLEIFIITQVSPVVLYPQNCCGQEEDGPWSPDSKASCLARYFQCHSQSMADGLGCLWWIWGTLWWTAEVFHCEWPACPIWTVAGSCNVYLGFKWSSLDSVMSCDVFLYAMSRPIFSRAPRMARLLWGPQNGGGVLDSLDECRAPGKAMWNVSVEEMFQKTVQKTRD